MRECNDDTQAETDVNTAKIASAALLASILANGANATEVVDRNAGEGGSNWSGLFDGANDNYEVIEDEDSIVIDETPSGDERTPEPSEQPTLSGDPEPNITSDETPSGAERTPEPSEQPTRSEVQTGSPATLARNPAAFAEYFNEKYPPGSIARMIIKPSLSEELQTAIQKPEDLNQATIQCTKQQGEQLQSYIDAIKQLKQEVFTEDNAGADGISNLLSECEQAFEMYKEGLARPVQHIDSEALSAVGLAGTAGLLVLNPL